MLRGFVKPYKKLFDGEVFTTVRLEEIKTALETDAMRHRNDVIYLYPRTKRATRLGRAQIIGRQEYWCIDRFAGFCTEEFAQYDAQLSKEDFIASLKRQAKRRKIDKPWVIVYTYLWTEKEDGYYEAKEGMQE